MALSKIKSNSIEDAAITATQIATDAVDSAEIAADAVGTSEIAANAVAASELADDAVDTNAIADDAVTGAKVALFDDSLAATTTHFLIADGTDYSSFALSGDVTSTNAGAVTIADNAVTLTKLADGTQGGIVYYGASGAPTELAVGTSGQALLSGGAAANLSWGTAGISGLVGLVENDSVWLGNDPSGTTSTASFNVGVGTTALDATTTGDNNTGVGYGALGALNTGSANVVVGAYAGDAITDATDNVAVGQSALSANISGTANVAIGKNALEISTASNCIGIGMEALVKNTSGTANVAIGKYSMQENIGATDNSGVGYKTLKSNTTGSSNIAMGTKALEAMDGATANVALGVNSQILNSSGSYNTSVGMGTMSAALTGNGNTQCGYGGASGITSGTYNCGLGHGALAGGSPSGNVTTGSGQFCLGDSNVTDLYCADTSISGSDQRDKADITDFTHGLSFVKQLRPVTYKWDKRAWYAGDNPTPQDILDAVPDGTHKKTRVNLGLVAQEVLVLEQEIGFGTSKEDRLVTSITDDETSMGLKYERIVPILVNAIKELLTRIETLESA